MDQSQPHNYNPDLIICYQTHDYPMGGLIIKRGYFVSRNGMRITKSFKTVEEILKLFPLATIANSALLQMAKDMPRQLALFPLKEKWG